MDDLIISINARLSQKNKFIVIETYYTNISINKFGKYVGSTIQPADVIYCRDVNNCDFELVKECFSKFCFQISQNSYYISLEDLNVLFNHFSEKTVFFIDNSDKSLFVVKKINSCSFAKKTKYSYTVDGLKLKYSNDNNIYIYANNENAYQTRKIIPIPYLFYSKNDRVYNLCFDYNGNKSPYLEKKLALIDNEIIYLKNFNFENELSKLLIKKNFTKLSLAKFIYSGHYNHNDLEQLLCANGVTILSNEDELHFDVNVNQTDSEWFELDLNCMIDEETVNLASQIQLFASQNFISYKDKKIFLPDSIIEAKDNIIVENNRLKINKKNIFSLMRIIYESDSSIKDFFSYTDVKIDLSKYMKEIAFNYQLNGIKWLKFLYLNKLGGCLADDMGLGKTFQIIGFLSENEVRKSIDKVLIIAPKSILTNWEKEFNKFNSEYKVGIYHGEKRTSFNFNNVDIIISTYNTVNNDLEKIQTLSLSVIIFDEIQIVKNQKSILSNAMKDLKGTIKIGLSGTPMENNISELWNVMDIINPGLFLNRSSFLTRYNNKNYDELKSILNLFILRRMKHDVLNDLPEKNEQIIYCDMDEEQRKLYNSINYAVKMEISKLKAFSASAVLKGLLLLRECCCHPRLLDEFTNINHISNSCKIDTLDVLVDNLVSSGHKILIFSQFTKMLGLINESLKRYNDIIFYLDGKSQNRSEIVESFESANKGIFLISIKAGGVGLNLTSAEDVIIFDPWWNPFVEQQAIDRAYRIGQKKNVTIYKLVAANTLEEKILDLQKKKEKNFDEIINGVPTDKNVNLKDVLKLL